MNGGVFRIDHDQALQSTGVFRYQHKNAEWVTLTWRYDSGLVVSGIPDSTAALAFDGGAADLDRPRVRRRGGDPDAADHELQWNGHVEADYAAAGRAGERRSQSRPREGATRLQPRVPGRTICCTVTGRVHFTASLNIANLTNKVALYNFLSTFSGTHFLEPRSVTVRIGLVF